MNDLLYLAHVLTGIIQFLIKMVDRARMNSVFLTRRQSSFFLAVPENSV